MQPTTIGHDLAKHVFQVHGVDGNGDGKSHNISMDWNLFPMITARRYHGQDSAKLGQGAYRVWLDSHAYCRSKRGIIIKMVWHLLIVVELHRV
jgi:hypothetical protein